MLLEITGENTCWILDCFRKINLVCYFFANHVLKIQFFLLSVTLLLLLSHIASRERCFFSCLVPVTSSSAVLVACPDPLVACTVYLPLFASVTAGITSLARPSLNEICTPGRVAAERTWPSRYQLTSGTGKPKEKVRQKEIKMLWNYRYPKLP